MTLNNPTAFESCAEHHNDDRFRRYPMLASEEALEQFIAEWHAGVLPKAAWTHAAHIAAAAYHGYDCSPDELFHVMKSRIIFFNECTGTVNGEDSGYHETLTRFWCQIIGDFLEKGNFSSRYEAASAAVEKFGEDRDLYRNYYDFDVLRDRRARREWIPPQ